MCLFYVLTFFKKGDIIQGVTSLKGGAEVGVDVQDMLLHTQVV